MRTIQTDSSDLVHGGQLQKQAKKYNIPAENWLDLSTGISPYSYPVQTIPSSMWRRLPEFSDSLLKAVKQYYGSSKFVACAGSQAAIQAIPQVWKQVLKFSATRPAKIWLPKVGYKEHQKHWISNGFSITHYVELPNASDLEENSVVVVINPNNPSGAVYDSKILLELANTLAKKNGLLIIDEAFIDSNLSLSIATKASHFKNLIILRSIGKFFGLAGIRLGFAFANDTWLKQLKVKLGEWPISGPSLYIAEKALSDSSWQSAQRFRLDKQSMALHSLLRRVFNLNSKGCNLFRTINLANATEIFESLCKQAVYVRLTDDKKSLRFGIPDSDGFFRLEKALLNSMEFSQNK
ncbi:MAG: threonine-phosphate decarboxylase CobD [Kangiellaceae bacterium]